MFGALHESFATAELLRLVSWSTGGVVVRHWREGNGAEIDIVLEWPAGGSVAIEVRASRAVNAGDARHLERLRDGLGERFRGGVVLHLTDGVRRLGDRLWTAPQSVLWEGATSR